MNYKMMGRLISQIVAVEAVFAIPALLICIYDGDHIAAQSTAYSIMIMLAVAGAGFLLCRNAKRGFYAREGLVCVGLSWIVMSILGCLPFYLSGAIPSYVDALFEIVSGFTTTGASIMPEVESMARGLLYWRSFSHWVGGMGVLVFILAILPASGRSDGSTLHLLRAESPGPNVSKLVPRMRRTAAILYLLYIGLTVLNFIFLMLGGMPLFDSVCTALGTAGTGGFGIKNDSIASYSPYLQNVCTVFMLLFGVNFTCYHLVIMRQFKAVFKDNELRMYVAVILISTAAIAINIRSMYTTLEETVRHSAFQVATVMTTTGFSTTDFDAWPAFSKAILLCLMLMGACAGSTGGGMKVSRVMLLFKSMRRNVRQVLHPQKVQAVLVNGQPVEERIITNTNIYLAAYMFICIASFIAISVDNFSITTNISAVVACFNNIGPGFEAVGPMCNYAGYSAFSKLVLIADMLAGRLEIFPILVLASKSTWYRK